MFENITVEMIRDRMLDRMPAGTDKREGSVNWNAVAAAALEFKNMLIEADGIYQETFVDTASRWGLILRGKERKLYPYPATYAIGKAVFNMEVPIGSRFSVDLVNFTITARVSQYTYLAQCETAGTEGNRHLGDMIPIEYIQGLKKAVLEEILIPGEDEEDTESFRQRILDSYYDMSYAGNIAYYKKEVKAIPGVGAVKVYPIWNGPGTVGIELLDSEYDIPTEELIEEVQQKVDPVDAHGHGMAIAPIGHYVTIMAAQALEIDVIFSLTYQDGYDWEKVKPSAEESIKAYLLELTKEWENTDMIVVRISQIERRLLDLEGVLDISGTRLNAGDANLLLSESQIPQLGVIADAGS